MKSLKLVFWRWRLKARYLHYRKLTGSFNCGTSLAEHLSLRVADARRAVNAAIRKCNVLDPARKMKEL